MQAPDSRAWESHFIPALPAYIFAIIDRLGNKFVFQPARSILLSTVQIGSSVIISMAKFPWNY